VQLDGLAFSKIAPGEFVPVPFAMFSPKQVYLEGTEFVELFGKRARHFNPDYKVWHGARMMDLNTRLSTPSSFNPESDMPLCKLFRLASEVEANPMAKSKIDGVYTSVQSLDGNAPYIGFVRKQPRDSDSIAPEFYMSCGFAKPASSATSGTPQSQIPKLNLDLSRGRGFSSLDEFTLGDFMEVFDLHADNLEVYQ